MSHEFVAIERGITPRPVHESCPLQSGEQAVRQCGLGPTSVIESTATDD